jgi:flagellar biosynthesis regulator FlbT
MEGMVIMMRTIQKAHAFVIASMIVHCHLLFFQIQHCDEEKNIYLEETMIYMKPNFPWKDTFWYRFRIFVSSVAYHEVLEGFGTIAQEVFHVSIYIVCMTIRKLKLIQTKKK